VDLFTAIVNLIAVGSQLNLGFIAPAK